MAVKLLKYFLLFFILVMVFLLTKDPYALHLKKDSKIRPDVELFNVKNLEISQKGVLSIVFTDKIDRFKKYDTMYMIDALHKGENGLIDSLTADKGVLKRNILYLNKNVKYTRSDDVTLLCDAIVYNIKNRVLKGKKGFKFIRKNSVTVGDSFEYKMKRGVIKADKIKTIIRVDR